MAQPNKKNTKLKMIKNFFDKIENILVSESSQKKIELFRQFYEDYKKGANLSFLTSKKPKIFDKPSYHKICTIVPPQKVPKRGAYTTKEGQGALLHAICHIEYSAIDLALDAVYRFRGLPKSFYDDWLEVADDEVRHFLMLKELLNETGYDYGDFEVHNALFEAMQRTQSLLERMAIVPRYLEANGLDATPQILKKLKNYKSNPFIQKVVSALQIILDEEIEHVKKGDSWFEWICDKEGVGKSIYFDIVSKHYPNVLLKKRDINIEARLKAGFACKELEKISKEDICDK